MSFWLSFTSILPEAFHLLRIAYGFYPNLFWQGQQHLRTTGGSHAGKLEDMRAECMYSNDLHLGMEASKLSFFLFVTAKSIWGPALLLFSLLIGAKADVEDIKSFVPLLCVLHDCLQIPDLYCPP